MATADPKASRSETWQQAIQAGFSDPKALLDFLSIPEESIALSLNQPFATKVPRSFAEQMEKGNPHCPLLRQVLPLAEEERSTKGFTHDPLAEANANPVKGLLHKYHGRVLLLFASQCAVNCRYCFRRHFPYADNRVARREWDTWIDYIDANESIHEVILSGGDPLMASNDSLALFIAAIETIPHVKTLRIHTRLPIVVPSRMDEGLVSLMAKTRLNVVMVYHCNHANELVPEIASGVSALKANGVTVLNQAVLLAGVNDDALTLTNLSHDLFHHGILPYYLHMLDSVSGASHFLVEEEIALNLFKVMQESLPGYLVPRLVREVAGMAHKCWL